jgi:MFS family permease
MIEMGRFFTGLAAAFCFLSCIRLASRWFPTYKLALVVGVIVTMAMMGGMIAQTPLTYLTDQFGWRHALRFDALLGIGILLVISLCVRNFPPDQCNDSHASNNKLKSDGFWRVLKTTLMNKQNWLGGIYTSLLNLPIFILGGTWGSLYLMQAHGFSHQSSSYIDSMIFVGTIIGSPLVGWISDKLGRRKTPMMVCSILSILVIFALMIAPYQLPLTVFMLLFFALGLFTSAQVISYPLIAESNPIEITATAESIASVLIMSGGMMVPVFGWLMGLHWHHTYLNHAPFYSTGDYRLAMSILPVAFLLSLITSFLIRETYGVRACLKSAKL